MEAEVRPFPSSSVPPPSKSSIYAALQKYAFTLDPDFQSGLASLTSDPSLSPSEIDETIFQAQCFYFARKYNLPPIDPSDYKLWLSQQTAPTQTAAEEHLTHIAAQPLERSSTTPSVSTAPKTEDGPPYPASFESIVDLITRNQPIPGIEEIPDTVLDASLSAPNQTAQRKKPWETDDAVRDIEPVLSDAMGTADGKRTGVVGILQPIKKLEEGEGINPGALEDNNNKDEDIATSNSAKEPVLADAVGE